MTRHVEKKVQWVPPTNPFLASSVPKFTIQKLKKRNEWKSNIPHISIRLFDEDWNDHHTRKNIEYHNLIKIVVLVKVKDLEKMECDHHWRDDFEKLMVFSFEIGENNNKMRNSGCVNLTLMKVLFLCSFFRRV